MEQWQNDSGRWKPKYSDKTPVSMQIRPSNKLHSHPIQDVAMKGGERPLSDGTALKPEFDLQIIRSVSTSEKTLLPYGKDRVVMNVGVLGVPVIVRTMQNTLLCEMRGPVFQHLACTATTVP
jgi:hypothetical protein